MLESFRKYTGLMFVILILLFVGLVFFGTGQQSLVSGPSVVKAHGRSFSEQDWNRFAANPARLLRELAGHPFQNRGSFGAIESYLRRMGVIAFPGYELTNDQILNFLVNRYTLQQGMKDYGVHASNEAVAKFLQETIFVAPDGSFDAVRYQDFIKDRLPRLGMGEREMYNVLGEVISIGKLEEIIGSGIDSSRDAVAARYLNQAQKIDYQLVNFPSSRFEADQNPSEEEVKTYWEENKGKYMSKPKRRLSYILATPDFEKLEAEKKAAAETAGEAKPETASEETPAGEEDKEEKPEEDPGLTPEERTAAVVAVGGDLDNFWDLLQEQEGEGFEELAKERGFEILTTELVTESELPKEFEAGVRGAPGKTGANAVFGHNPGENKWDATSDVYGLGKEQWLLFRIEESIEPKELAFEEARDDAHLDLVKKRAREEMTKTAEEKYQKLKEAIEAGTELAKAAEELVLKLEPRTGVTRGRPGAEQREFEAAAFTNPGQLSEVQSHQDEKIGIDRAFFVHVDKREVTADQGLESRIDQQASQEAARLQGMALDSWFEQKRMLADVQPSPGLRL